MHAGVRPTRAAPPGSPEGWLHASAKEGSKNARTMFRVSPSAHKSLRCTTGNRSWNRAVQPPSPLLAERGKRGSQASAEPRGHASVASAAAGGRIRGNLLSICGRTQDSRPGMHQAQVAPEQGRVRQVEVGTVSRFRRKVRLSDGSDTVIGVKKMQGGLWLVAGLQGKVARGCERGTGVRPSG